MIYLALYQGVGLVSRVHRWLMWSDYSHGALIQQAAGGGGLNRIEAWAATNEVREVHNLSEGYEKGTKIDLFEFRFALSETEEAELWRLARKEVGKKYDFKGVFSFLLRRRMQDCDKWFCFELMAEVCKRAGRMLVGLPSWKVAGNLIAGSVTLKFARRVVVK